MFVHDDKDNNMLDAPNNIFDIRFFMVNIISKERKKCHP